MERPLSLFVTDMLQMPFESILDVAKKKKKGSKTTSATV